ncbi:unnamed protein product [Bursaphelenchus xylophilus]|uniref:(pine wood nematode) hypothetical protein n=1 Tax=Bursaphelenchus xylophilus TaxID=6326 RepID=A0A1I7RIA1_BURXY|nr:unnamed protein product [Bursaphelenchus xylophilus]CAG9115054.1 unnamed protein product [Bursaphelenchus xylophilus]
MIGPLRHTIAPALGSAVVEPPGGHHWAALSDCRIRLFITRDYSVQKTRFFGSQKQQSRCLHSSGFLCFGQLMGYPFVEHFLEFHRLQVVSHR